MKLNQFRKTFLPTVLLFLIISVFLNVFLYSQLRRYYTLLYAVELDPLGLSAFQNTNQQKPAEGLQTVIFFGDSRAAQWPSPALDGFLFINRGIGNQTSAQVVNRFEEHIEPLQPDVVIIEVGINDLKTIPLFPERKQEIISACEENIHEIVQESLRLNSVVIISTIFPTGTVPLERRLVWSEDIDKAITEVNEYIRSLTVEKVFIFDASRFLSNDNGKLKSEYSFDELHLNEAGYEALNFELVKLLKSIKQN